MIHAGAAETSGTPLFQVAVDFDCLCLKNRRRSKWIIIMIQTVDADFESTVRQVLTHCLGNHIIPGNEIEGGAETETLFNIRELHAPFEASRCFDIMGQDKSEFLPIRPAGPSFRRFAGIRINWPDICVFQLFIADKISAQLNLQPPGNEEF